MLEDLVGDDGSGAPDAAPDSDAGRAALDTAGHGDLAPELMGEALVHYADAASLEVADALSPIVIAASAVPFDPELDPTPTPADAAAGGGFASDEEERREVDEEIDEDLDPDSFDDAVFDIDAEPTETDDTPRPDTDNFGRGSLDEAAATRRSSGPGPDEPFAGDDEDEAPTLQQDDGLDDPTWPDPALDDVGTIETDLDVATEFPEPADDLLDD